MYYYTEDDNRTFAAQIAAAQATRDKDEKIAELTEEIKQQQEIINRQKAEIERLNKEVDRLSQCVLYHDGHITDAIKEFADKVSNFCIDIIKFKDWYEEDKLITYIEILAKETAGAEQ